MSEKIAVPTFRIFLHGQVECLEGPIVAPNKQTVAQDMSQVHEILHTNQATLIYAKQWVYIPVNSIHHIERGGSRFSLPWPLTD
jgi:hypothetical protein